MTKFIEEIVMAETTRYDETRTIMEMLWDLTDEERSEVKGILTGMKIMKDQEKRKWREEVKKLNLTQSAE